MLFAALRDMQWRMRRLVIAVVSTGLVFAMTLVLTGLANGFRVEAQRTVDSMGVDAFVVKAGAAGPFLGATPFAQVDLARVASRARRRGRGPTGHRGVDDQGRRVERETPRRSGRRSTDPGCRASRRVGHRRRPDEVAVSSTLGRHIGDESAGRCAHIADRRHRAQFHRTGEDAQHLPDDRGPAATGVQRAADHHVDRDHRHTPSSSRTATRPSIERPVSTTCCAR